MTESLPSAPDVAALATLVALGRRVRSCRDAAELAFVAVNETHALVPYRQAVLWLSGRGVAALSGVVQPEANAPYVHWLQGVLESRVPDSDAPGAQRLQREQLPAELAAAWHEWLPEHALLLPLHTGPAGEAAGWLLLAREDAWDDGDLSLLQEWGDVWSQARRLHQRRPLWRWSAATTPSWRVWLTRALPLVLVAAASSLPVRLTVLAPADLVALNPAVVRAPLDGVVGKVLVQPNQRVRAGEALFEFDRASLESRLEIARRALGTVHAEYRQKAQRALFDADSKGQLAALQGQIDEKQTEVAYLSTLNSRGTVPAPRAGVVLFGDPSEWSGRPVVTGERVMVVADEQEVELEAWLSPADALPLPVGSTVTMFLNTDPLQPLHATLRYVAHEPVERPDGHHAYRVRATLAPGQAPRIGLKGTARIEGASVPAAYWMLRRPLAAARAWAGL